MPRAWRPSTPARSSGDPVVFKTTVHGPVTGYATVDGRKVAISSKRSSYGEDVLDLLFNRRISNGQVHDPKSFFNAAAKTPQTFNSFYIDDEHVAEYTAGKLPIRAKGVDPGLLTNGTGKYEWTGFLSKNGHPHGTDPKDGTMTNWNQVTAKGFGSADDEWGRAGSAERVDMLDKNLKRLQQNGKWTMAQVASAMNAGATQDIRAIDTVPLLAKLLDGTQAPSPMARSRCSSRWSTGSNDGGSRLDTDDDGLIDAPGAAVDGRLVDEHRERADAAAARLRADRRAGHAVLAVRPAAGRSVLGLVPVLRPRREHAARQGHPEPAAPVVLRQGQARQVPERHLERDPGRRASEIAVEQGTDDPSQWHSDATAEEIHFSPLPLKTMAYTNRPSGIQQVISFDGHRKNK